MKITIELSEQDLERFRDAMDRARAGVRSADDCELLDSVRDALAKLDLDEKPAYIRDRVRQVARLVDMVEDDEFSMPRDAREEIIKVLVYFCDPEDLIPDEVPVVGLLDDAIMLELLLREEAELLQAYQRFCAYRDALGPRPDDYQARKAWAAELRNYRDLTLGW